MNFRHFTFLILLFWFLAGAILVYAEEPARITEFSSILKINTDASLEVTEKIVYVHSSESAAGLTREIPLTYRARGGKYALSVSHLSVTDESGRSYTFKMEDVVTGKRIVVEHPPVSSEPQTYVIKYKITRAINYFETYDELAWNVTGNRWSVGIEKVAVKILLPVPTSKEKLGALCFAEDFGGKDSCSSVLYEGDEAGVNTISFTRANLPPGGDMNVVVKIPSGVVYRPTFFETFWLLIRDNLIFFFPVLVFLFMFIVWEEKGKAPRGSGVIEDEFDVPRLLTPMALDAVLHEAVRPRAWAAEIVFLGTRGHLTIERLRGSSGATEGGYVLTRLTGDGKLSASDETFMRLLFAKDDSASFPTTQVSTGAFTRLARHVHRDLVKQGYFPSDPQRVRRSAAIFYTLVVTLGFLVVFSYLRAPFGAYGYWFLLLSLLIVLFFALFMPYHLNDKVLMKDKIFGFKNYLSGFKTRRRARSTGLSPQEEFEAWLPYALALGEEKKWAGQFSDLPAVRWSWYHTSVSSEDLTPLALVYHLGDLVRAGIAAARGEVKAAPRKPDFWEK